MGEISVRAPFFLSALLSFFNFFLSFSLPETLKLSTKNKFRIIKLNPFFNMSYVFKIPLFKGLFFCFFLIAFANTVYPAIWSFWGREVFRMVFRNDWFYSSMLRLLTIYCSSICNTTKVFLINFRQNV